MPVKSSVQEGAWALQITLRNVLVIAGCYGLAYASTGPWSDELELQKQILQSHVDLPADTPSSCTWQ